MLKVAVVGSRWWTDYDWFAGQMDTLRLKIEAHGPWVIVTGGTEEEGGIDGMAVRWARERGLPTPIIFQAEWARFGKRAGPIRNTDIANEANVGLAFWDGKSKGTKDTITKLRAQGKAAHVVYLPGSCL